MADLATELSYGAVAGISLAPEDHRLAAMSREVLAGGATRFASAIEMGRPIRYVIPVRLPDDDNVPGALVVQQDRLALIWRNTTGLHKTVWSQLDQYTLIFESTGEFEGEPWTRFRVKDAAKSWGFIVPPVRGGLLVPTLRSNLRAWLRQEKRPTPPLPAPVAASPVPAPAPTEVVPLVVEAPPHPVEATLILPAVLPTDAEPPRWVHKSSPAAVLEELPQEAETSLAILATEEPSPDTLLPSVSDSPLANGTPRSATLLGFLIGLATTLVVGGIWLVSQLIA